MSRCESWKMPAASTSAFPANSTSATWSATSCTPVCAIGSMRRRLRLPAPLGRAFFAYSMFRVAATQGAQFFRNSRRRRIRVGLAHRAGALLFSKPRHDDVGEDGGELIDVAAKGDDLADQAAAGQGVLIAGHDEDGFHAAHGAVGQGKLELI